MNIIVESAVSRKINKVKLGKNGGLEITFELTEIIQLNGKDFSRVSEHPGVIFREIPHPDLIHAFNLMRAHYVIIAGQLDGKNAELDKVENNEDFIALFKITGFSIGGNGESEGVTLIGNKKIKRGIINIPAPFTKFFDEQDPYEYADELQHLVMHATDEVNKYIDGKIAPDAQGKIDFDENSDLE